MRLFVTVVLVLTAVPAAAEAAITYGPALGRGRDQGTMIVRWGTSEPGPTELLVRTAGSGARFTLHTGPFEGVHHEVVVTGLAPSTLYEYIAKTGSDVAAESFATCPGPGEPLTFVSYGDNRNGMDVHAELIDLMIADAPDVVLHNGDLVATGTVTEYLGEYYPVAAPLVRQVPLMPAVGNHDLSTPFYDGFALLFPTPKNLLGERHSYYAFACGNALFIALDANYPDHAGQLAFLDETLAEARADASVQHVIPFFHQSPYSSSSGHGDVLTVRAAWAPLFEDPANKVTIALSGHDHAYERILANGLTYVVSGGGGAPLHVLAAPTEGATSLEYKSAHHYVRITLRGRELEAEAIDRTGVTIDSFVLWSSVPDLEPPDRQPGDPQLAGVGGGGGCVAGGGAPGGSIGLAEALLVLGALLQLIRRRSPKRKWETGRYVPYLRSGQPSSSSRPL